jgi:hypothetical protein
MSILVVAGVPAPLDLSNAERRGVLPLAEVHPHPYTC